MDDNQANQGNKQKGLWLTAKQTHVMSSFLSLSNWLLCQGWIPPPFFFLLPLPFLLLYWYSSCCDFSSLPVNLTRLFLWLFRLLPCYFPASFRQLSQQYPVGNWADCQAIHTACLHLSAAILLLLLLSIILYQVIPGTLDCGVHHVGSVYPSYYEGNYSPSIVSAIVRLFHWLNHFGGVLGDQTDPTGYWPLYVLDE